MRAAIAGGLLLVACLAASAPGAHAPGSPQPGDGWIDLMKPEVWRKFDPGWITTDAVRLDPEKATRLKAEKKANGPIWVNGEKGRLPDLVTKESFADCEVHVEFLIAKNSNSGIKLHAVYEVQILDSYGTKKELTGDSMGGIYPRADDSKGYRHIDKVIPPKVNGKALGCVARSASPAHARGAAYGLSRSAERPGSRLNGGGSGTTKVNVSIPRTYCRSETKRDGRASSPGSAPAVSVPG